LVYFGQADSVLLLEEPELSLHSSIVDKLPALIHRLTQNLKRKRQVILTTHSSDLLSDQGIDGGEVIILSPDTEGTRVERATSREEIRRELESGFSVAEVIKPRTEPRNVNQLPLFK
jgi:predicted ATP-dependent endonuclease of OLD family